MKLQILLFLLVMTFVTNVIGQNKLTCTTLPGIELNYKLQYAKDPTSLFVTPDGGFKAIAYKQYRDGAISVKTFNSNGVEVSEKMHELEKAPFNGQSFWYCIEVDGSIVVVTAPENRMIERETDGGHWSFWKLEESGFVFLKEIDLKSGYHRASTNVHQSKNKKYTLLEIDKGEGFIVLNKNFEIEGDYDLFENDNGLHESIMKLDNVIIDDEGNIGFSLLILGKAKGGWFGNSSMEASWLAGSINNKTKNIGSFNIGNVIQQETYIYSSSRFLDLNDNEFLLLNKGRDIIRFDKVDGSLIGSGKIDIFKYCAIKEKDISNYNDVFNTQVARIDDGTICFITQTSRPYTYQLFISRTDGTVLSSDYISPPVELGSVDGIEFYKSKPYFTVDKNSIHLFVRLSENELEAVKSQNFNGKKIKYGSKRNVYHFTFDLKGEQTNLEQISEVIPHKYEQLTFDTTADLERVRISLGDGKKMTYIVTHLEE